MARSPRQDSTRALSSSSGTSCSRDSLMEPTVNEGAKPFALEGDLSVLRATAPHSRTSKRPSPPPVQCEGPKVGADSCSRGLFCPGAGARGARKVAGATERGRPWPRPPDVHRDRRPSRAPLDWRPRRSTGAGPAPAGGGGSRGMTGAPPALSVARRMPIGTHRCSREGATGDTALCWGNIASERECGGHVRSRECVTLSESRSRAAFFDFQCPRCATRWISQVALLSPRRGPSWHSIVPPRRFAVSPGDVAGS